MALVHLFKLGRGLISLWPGQASQTSFTRSQFLMQQSPTLLSQLTQLNERLAAESQKDLVLEPKLSKIRDSSFPKQSAFIDDKKALKAGFCTRRAGKSFSGAMLLADAAESYPGSSVLYLAKTRDTAKRILWKDCLSVVNRRFELNLRPNMVELSMTHPNGAVIYLSGADANADELEKLLGQKYSRVVIDEAQSWKQDLHDLVYNKLKPAVADYRGQIILLGTPSNQRAGLFFEITNGLEPGWAVHNWSAFDNPYMAVQWGQEIDDLTARNPNIVSDPGFRQNYLGEWTIERDALVYQYSQELNSLAALPTMHRKDQEFYVIGIDLGYSPDPSAVVVAAYRKFDRNLYFVEAHKWPELTLGDLAERIRPLQKKYPNAKLIVDAANKQAVEEMKQRYSLPLEAAEKHGKEGYIALMNAEFASGTIKVLPEAQALSKEWETLTWTDAGVGRKREENPMLPNHCSDAGLYAWRWAYNYAWQNVPKEINIHSEEKVNEFWENEAERAERERQSIGYYDDGLS